MAPPVVEPIGLFIGRHARALGGRSTTRLPRPRGTLPAWLVLASVKGARHGMQRQVAADVGIDGATVTHHLNRMEAAGLVTRTA